MVVLKKINPRIPNVLVAVTITTLISFFTGYNNDAKIDVSSIQAPTVAEKISAFNRLTDELSSLSAERTAIGLQADEEVKKLPEGHGKSVELIQLQSQTELLTLKINDVKKRIHLLRTELRTMKFEGAKNKDSLILYPHGAIPDGVMTDKNTWRLKVGNSSLKPQFTPRYWWWRSCGFYPKRSAPIFHSRARH